MVAIDNSLIEAAREHRGQWFDLALSTQDLDVPAVQEAVALTYLLAGVPPPERLVWLDSPLSGCVAAAVFNRCYQNLYHRLWYQPVESMMQSVWKQAAEGGNTEIWQDVHRVFKANLFSIAERVSEPIRRQVERQLEVRFKRRTFAEGSQQILSEDVWGYICARIEQQLSEQDFLVFSRCVFDHNFAAACVNQSWYCGLGGQDAESVEMLSLAENAGYDVRAARGVLQLSRHCSWWWVFDKVCIVTYRPVALNLDALGRLHNDSGPAVEYLDGWTIYARHGAAVPSRVIDFGLRKSLREIETEQNAEIRRHLIEIYGIEQYLKDAEAVKIHEDSCGVLYRKDFVGDEPIKMVKVRNSTPEPDGTHKWYYLRVPPDVETAREAVAWTFGLEASQYNPVMET